VKGIDEEIDWLTSKSAPPVPKAAANQNPEPGSNPPA
jgi:hypothetical protein